MTQAEILNAVLEEQKQILCDSTSMHLDMICEKLFYTYGKNATFSGKSIYIDNVRVASITTTAEAKNCIGIYKYKIL